MSVTSRISTTAVVLHQNDQGETLRSTRLPGFYQHRMPDVDMPFVAELKNLTTGEAIEYRTYRGETYRCEPERAKEASGGCTYLRLPEDEAEQVVASYNRRAESISAKTLAYQGTLWVAAPLPTYRVVETPAAIEVGAGSEPTSLPQFNGLQKTEAVQYALRLGEQRDLPITQTHLIEIADPSLAGPAAATTGSSAIFNTVRQRLDAIAGATANLKSAAAEEDLRAQIDELVLLVGRLDADTRALRAA